MWQIVPSRVNAANKHVLVELDHFTENAGTRLIPLGGKMGSLQADPLRHFRTSARRKRPSRAWKPVLYVAPGGPNHVVSASTSPSWVWSPTQATYPSGRITMAVGAVTTPMTGSSHGPPYVASIN